jgi:UDP-N-acetylmuramoylalanine--D-glutamate ligase
VSATDAAPREAVARADELERAGVELDLGGHDPAPFERADVVVVSPGVPDLDVLHRAAAAGAEVISEVELAYRASRADVVGVTGSNGKSTVTTMTGAILERSVRPTWTGGNLGTPPSEAVGTEADVEGGVLVLELSSFQLERVSGLRCAAATILNVSPDHMDRYPDMAAYADAKGNVFASQAAGDHAVVLAGEAEAIRQARRGGGRLHVVGGSDSEVFARRGVVHVRLAGLPEVDLSIADLGLRDALAVKNAVASIALAMLCGAGEEAVVAGLAGFRPLAHRFELVAETRGVRWIDDSKATNPAAVVAALRAARPPVILVAGGLDKELDYGAMVPAVREAVERVLLIGEAAPVIGAALEGVVPVEETGTLEAAVERAASLARPGCTVLLSPACASFDQFRSFAHRGDVFRELALRAAGEA